MQHEKNLMEDFFFFPSSHLSPELKLDEKGHIFLLSSYLTVKLCHYRNKCGRLEISHM